jgi:small subunit ribosomal protein S6
LRTYEVVFISAPNTAEGDLSKITTQLENVVSERGGKVTKIDNWGRRKLAYRIRKFDEGIYTLLHIEGTGKEISEVERRLRVTDFVIRHLTVRTDEDLKRSIKMKAKRKAVLVPREKEEDFDLEEVMENEEDLLG